MSDLLHTMVVKLDFCGMNRQYFSLFARFNTCSNTKRRLAPSTSKAHSLLTVGYGFKIFSETFSLTTGCKSPVEAEVEWRALPWRRGGVDTAGM